SPYTLRSHTTTATPSLHDALPIFAHGCNILRQHGDAFFCDFVGDEGVLEIVLLPLAEFGRASDGAGSIGDHLDTEIHFEPGKAQDRKSTRLNSSHRTISYAVFCLK